MKTIKYKGLIHGGEVNSCKYSTDFHFDQICQICTIFFISHPDEG